MSELRVSGLDYTISNKKILDQILVNVLEGEFVGLIGPNGCGKSTLLKNIYKVYKPDCGEIRLGELDALRVSNMALAKELAVMVQENSVEFDMPVIEMVMLGRYVHRKHFQDTSKEDLAIARKYLAEVGLPDFEERSFRSLSGGEKQRVLVARALAQDTRFIILDEPTNHLDIGYQYLIMSILKRQKVTIFAAMHDLNIAAYYCDKVVMMEKGRIVATGTPEEAFTEERIRALFHIDTHITRNERTGRMQISYEPDAGVMSP